MINYPNKKNKSCKKTKTTSSIVYSNRGMNLERSLNETNDYYLFKNIANIHKKPTPVNVLKVDRDTKRITNAYYEKASTTDYNGIYKGFYIDYEAKQTASKTSFSFNNIHKHQIVHLKNVLDHGAISFIIISFTKLDEVYLYETEYLYKYYEESLSGGRKSIPYESIKSDGYLIKEGYKPRLDYIKILDELIKK